MIFYYRIRERQSCWILTVFVFGLTLVSCREETFPSHQTTPDASTLKIEAKESEASITLGKDLLLGPPLSTKPQVIVNASNFDDIGTTEIDSLVTPTIINQIPSDRGAAFARKPVSKDTSSRWSSHALDGRRWISKSPKTAWKKDSYLEALRYSRTSDDPREGIVRTGDSKAKTNRREYALGPIYKPEVEYGPPDSTYAPKNPQIAYGSLSVSSPTDGSYSQPFRPSIDFNDHYNVPQNSYGPPQNSYGNSPTPPFRPQTSYPGSSGNSYLPPQQGYGASIQVAAPSPVYGAPYALPDLSPVSILPSFDLSWPLAIKLNAFTLAKIILKLVIFKMIVKFIAVICLLLFIPKLEIIKKKVNKDEEDEERGFSSPYVSQKTLNDLETMIRNSVERYEAENRVDLTSIQKCTTMECRVTDALTFRESWDDYLDLFKSYMEEERRVMK